MRRLPDRPNLEQLRRQAKELLAAAKAGDKSALRRVHAVSPELRLTSAQLAVARECGFASWARLNEEALRRLANAPEAGQRDAAAARRATQPMVRTWEQMREWMGSLLLKRTGEDVERWKQRIAAKRFTREGALRQWLTQEGVTGYSQTLLVWERFGYPSYMTASATDLIGRQYADRPQLRPILDRILAILPEVSPVIIVQARKTYISLVNQRRTFAQVQATTRKRLDLALRLEGQRPSGRLRSAKGIGNGSMTVKLELASPDDLDAEAIEWLRQAYKRNE